MLQHLWNAHQAGHDRQSLEAACTSARDWFYLAVLAFADGLDDAASKYAATAAVKSPQSRVYTAASTYLDEVGKQGRQHVYTEPEGFAAFIRGGGNVALYDALSAALRQRYTRYSPVSLLDIGVGDGLALLPALSGDVTTVDLVEPSAPMLESVSRELTQRGIAHDAKNLSVQQLAHGTGAWSANTRWTVAQATFSLHNVSSAERGEVLQWLREHVDRLLIAEFDLAPGTACEPEWFDYVTTRYENGLAEYDGDGGLVAQNFLMPVMFGYFDPATVHHEQPVADWRRDLARAGFTDWRQPQLLHDFWWAPGYLIDAG